MTRLMGEFVRIDLVEKKPDIPKTCNLTCADLAEMA